MNNQQARGFAWFRVGLLAVYQLASVYFLTFAWYFILSMAYHTTLYLRTHNDVIPRDALTVAMTTVWRRRPLLMFTWPNSTKRGSSIRMLGTVLGLLGVALKKLFYQWGWKLAHYQLRDKKSLKVTCRRRLSLSMLLSTRDLSVTPTFFLIIIIFIICLIIRYL